MRYVTRELESEVQRAARTFPALILTGPRRSGKTSLLRHVFPDASYFLMEDPNIVSRLRSDPAGFLDAIRPPVILDEVQNAPEVFAHVRSRIDMRPRRAGQWLLTGSQEAPLMRGVTESMAGRAAIMQLRPLSIRESPKVALLSGGYPEPLARPRTASLWFSSFIQTYLERDVRGVSDVKDLATFRRFLSIVASRHGQILNKTDLAGPLGVSVPTVASWLNVLELTAQIILVPPFYENLGKRLTKSPKVYIADSGLACFLLGIESRAELAKSPFLGAIFEGFVAGEIIKTQTNAGRRPEIYHFRDAQGLEVDFLVPGRSGRLTLVECKAARSVRPSDSSSLARVAAAIRLHRTPRTPLNLFVVHQPAAVPARFEVLTPEVKAVSIERLVEEIGQGGRG
ncbi:MAG: ATP-binding protein [Planctomycetota bacterium]|nr:ATP-binding protein [Planctomycetota bacterium]